MGRTLHSAAELQRRPVRQGVVGFVVARGQFDRLGASLSGIIHGTPYSRTAVSRIIAERLYVSSSLMDRTSGRWNWGRADLS